ncbi:MAG: hypothetical protein ACN6RD_00825, partial [Stenotrophomonas maltophilia]
DRGLLAPAAVAAAGVRAADVLSAWAVAPNGTSSRRQPSTRQGIDIKHLGMPGRCAMSRRREGEPRRGTAR